ncbi:FAD/NAD(P)-binding domain-containing protein [Cryphonectria parasitica EP155]|uniref:FAD/NAD(P)-binding domain-containing protein n=1 Tax=Cryphonectria parasitica (strain ATCC 38755 / EP155) TaxID=660469 RepID=A0A9P4YAM2_CRYP1|nr:FAD/NAD(P)-binding domain-containing protein [Cryphonectria parasitica EP155]KAF3769538.1 FAD/NAD(P)-binding domain-containing protein [Cryphonectria parasitica EP155]
MGSSSTSVNSYDIIIIGGGLAGINCAYRLQSRVPDAKFAILEARDDIGGTWEIFKYPGIRSDSDLHTYGFAWEPWPYSTPIAEGELILSYFHQCVEKYDLRKYMSFRHKVTGCDWSSEAKKWTLAVDNDGQRKVYEASFVVLGTGYYDYENPLPAVIPGLENFKGKIVHPQAWPTDYDFSEKEVVVVGSGATAITLIPNLAPRTKHVTMLQRSPTWIAAITNRAPFDGHWLLSSLIPRRLKAWLNWLYFAIVPFYRVRLCQRYPQLARKALLKQAGERLPADISTDPHFTPRYNPWEQRLCLSPEGDFFECLHGRDGKPAKAGVVTATIETVTEDGILCSNGQKLNADVIITATGLKIRFGGGVPLRVDGELVSHPEHIIWEGCMMNDVPNLMYMVGYAWASWTLGVDNTAILLCRLWKDMKKRGRQVAVPKFPQGTVIAEEDKKSWLELTSTYIKKDRTSPLNLKDGKGPWKARGNVWLDWLQARFGSVSRALALS